jgi:hypothetical protein
VLENAGVDFIEPAGGPGVRLRAAERGSGVSEQERLERAAVQLAWEMLKRECQPQHLAASEYWGRITERRRNRCRRMAAAILAAADGKDMDAT